MLVSCLDYKDFLSEHFFLSLPHHNTTHDQRTGRFHTSWYVSPFPRLHFDNYTSALPAKGLAGLLGPNKTSHTLV